MWLLSWLISCCIPIIFAKFEPLSGPPPPPPPRPPPARSLGISPRDRLILLCGLQRRRELLVPGEELVVGGLGVAELRLERGDAPLQPFHRLRRFGVFFGREIALARLCRFLPRHLLLQGFDGLDLLRQLSLQLLGVDGAAPRLLRPTRRLARDRRPLGLGALRRGLEIAELLCSRRLALRRRRLRPPRLCRLAARASPPRAPPPPRLRRRRAPVAAARAARPPPPPRPPRRGRRPRRPPPPPRVLRRRETPPPPPPPPPARACGPPPLAAISAASRARTARGRRSRARARPPPRARRPSARPLDELRAATS